MPKHREETHFGFQDVAKKEKMSLVNAVFSAVAPRYDLMNDIMSGGLHRLWKDAFLRQVSFHPEMRILDVATGTGDILKRLHESLKRRGLKAHIDALDPNPEMLANGQDRAIDNNQFYNTTWHQGYAENLPFEEATFDLYMISFGLRNTTDMEAALKEARRVLKPGGQFLCLEFTKAQNPFVSKFYDYYSFKMIPKIGAFVAQNEEAYQYLVESIRRFPSAPQLQNLMEEAGFRSVSFQTMTFGVVAIHEGWV